MAVEKPVAARFLRSVKLNHLGVHGQVNGPLLGAAGGDDGPGAAGGAGAARPAGV